MAGEDEVVSVKMTASEAAALHACANRFSEVLDSDKDEAVQAQLKHVRYGMRALEGGLRSVGWIPRDGVWVKQLLRGR